MARIVFPEHLLPVTQGTRQLELSAANFRELLELLESRWPGSQDVLAKCAVAIDGQIYQDAYLEPLQSKSEVFFMHRIEGG